MHIRLMVSLDDTYTDWSHVVSGGRNYRSFLRLSSAGSDVNSQVDRCPHPNLAVTRKLTRSKGREGRKEEGSEPDAADLM